MPSNTVAQFAVELKMPANTLLEQLRSAGVELKSVDDAVTDADKAKLLDSLRRAHGGNEGKKITLTRRQTSEIRQADGSGRSRTIQVEVRKKRTFVKRDTAELAAEALKAESTEKPEASAAEVPAAQVAADQPTAIDTAQAAQADTPVREETAAAAESTPEPTAASAAEPQSTEPTAEAVPVAPESPVVDAAASVPTDSESVAPIEPVVTPMEEAPPAAAEAAPVPTPVEAVDETPAQAQEPVEPTKPVQAPTAKASDRPARSVKRIPATAAAPAADPDRERARRAAEAEAAALREMLSRPRKVLKAPEPEAGNLSGTLHKPAAAKGAKKEVKAVPGEVKKTIKASDVSSSWSDESGRKKPAAKADAAAPGATRDGWRAGGKAGKGAKGNARGRGRNAQPERQAPAPAE